MPFDAQGFLTAFGYLDPAESNDPDKVEVAVADAQKAYGIPVTGDLDPMTEKVFERTPRCGVSDAEGLADGEAFWGLDVISWFVESFPVGIGLNRGLFEGAIAQAFANWSAIIPKDFRKADSVQQANIIFRAGRGNRAGFDGPGGTLAWMEVCQRPNYRGVLNGAFDGDESFVVDRAANGIRVVNVGTHEIGHALGFMHDTRSGQLMSPTYHPDLDKPQARDIARAQGVYGVRNNPTPTPTPTPPGTPPGTTSPSKVQILLSDNSVYQFENPTKLR